MKEEICKLKGNKTSLVYNTLNIHLDELGKLKENLLQQIMVQKNNMVELEKENDYLKQNIGGAPIACTHEEDIICLKREL